MEPIINQVENYRVLIGMSKARLCRLAKISRFQYSTMITKPNYNYTIKTLTGLLSVLKLKVEIKPED